MTSMNQIIMDSCRALQSVFRIYTPQYVSVVYDAAQKLAKISLVEDFISRSFGQSIDADSQFSAIRGMGQQLYELAKRIGISIPRILHDFTEDDDINVQNHFNSYVSQIRDIDDYLSTFSVDGLKESDVIINSGTG